MELVSAIAGKTEMTKKDTETLLKAFEEVVTDVLVAGDKVQWVGFCTLDVVQRKEREGRNPRDNSTMIIPSQKAVRFKAGKALKDAVNK